MITVYTEQDVPKNYMARQYYSGNSGNQYQQQQYIYSAGAVPLQQQYGYNAGMVPVQQQQFAYDTQIVPVQQQYEYDDAQPVQMQPSGATRGRKFVIIFGSIGCCILITLVVIFVCTVVLNDWGYIG